MKLFIMKHKSKNESKEQIFYENSRVVFTKNYDFKKGLTNGQIGQIIELREETIIVRVDDEYHEIQRYKKMD